jgi:protein-S-isoprenylcysteine O-methyltransferase Ste14
VTNGIFSITRNPIFVYIDLYFIGTALINANALFIIFALITVIGTHYQILQEEKHLNNLYKEEYVEYKKRVRRYL